MINIYIGSDHAGWETKTKLIEYLKNSTHHHNLQLIDCGCYSNERCDYPLIARDVALKVIESKDTISFGILICGTGIGMSITANRIQGVRCGIATNTEMAKMARLHNNCQVLAVGSRISTQAEIETIVSTFIGTPFDTVNTRHKNRINLIDI